MAHTNAPWRRNPRGTPDIGILAGLGPETRLLALVVQDEDNPLDDAELEANANLIAAAPDLLSTLKTIADEAGHASTNKGYAIDADAVTKLQQLCGLIAKHARDSIAEAKA